MEKSNCAWRGDFACSVRLEVYDEGGFLPLLPNEASQRTLRHLHTCTRCIEFSPIRAIPPLGMIARIRGMNPKFRDAVGQNWALAFGVWTIRRR